MAWIGYNGFRLEERMPRGKRMKLIVLGDIHGNLPALEAVLDYVEKYQKPDRIISVGDQINLGPCAAQVMELLKRHDVTCLHGNHERYVL